MMSDSPRSHRRDFLTGRAALRSLVGIGVSGNAAEPAANEPAASPELSYLLEITRRAMACEFQVLLNAGQYPRAEEVALQALDLIEELEQQLTIYRESSELSLLNRRAPAGPVVVEGRLLALLEYACELHRGTRGAFDITAGPLSRLWGFTRRAGRMPTDAEIAETLARVGSQFLELDVERQTMRFRQPGMELNLGAIGKGYALDRCAELFDEAAIRDYLIHGGQSSVLARGHRAGEQGWPIGLRHPLVPERRLGVMRLCDAALGTSGAANQFFYYQGKRYGHVLDPRTGRPAEQVLSATVIAPLAAAADALATAFYVMGLEESRAYCANHPELSALLVVAGEKVGELRFETLGLQAEAWTPD